MNEGKSDRYHRLRRRASVGSTVVSMAVPAALLLSGGASALRDLSVTASGASASSPITVAVFIVMVAALQEAAAFPLAWYRSFLLERRFGLSSETPGTWLADHAKATALAAAIGILAGEIVYATLRQWPRWWWLASAAIFAAGIALLARIAPVVLLPLFYKFKPLNRSELDDRLLALSKRAGVAVLGVFEWGLGEKTRRANAALVGAGRTRRILVSDTLLAEYSDDEIEVILAHELAHHVHGDMMKGMAGEVALITAALGTAAFALNRAIGPLGLTSPADVAGLPIILLAGGAVMLAGTPVMYALSRRNERRADRYALDMTGRPAAFISAMRRLGAQNLAEEHPSRLALWLFHSHPTVRERIARAQSLNPHP